MQYAESILDLVGNTPLVRLSRVTRELGPFDAQPLMLAKMETLNPGGSVKDRIGLPMIEAAERAGLLKPGGTIIEPTSGNTGHGLAIAAALKGYRCIFVMADKQSVEKQSLLRTKKPDIVVVGADPEGSVLSGDTARPYLTEGVGEDFFPGTYDPAMVDRWVRVSDRDAFAMARRITREEGILAGESCGTALIAAMTVARELVDAGAGAGKMIVVLLPDCDRNYLSKLDNDEWMRVNGLHATIDADA